ncbi:MAG: hypothetical protein LBJ61_10720 [Deltaproteobacteria bacterium]|nr:hypothetical protein [Deltaproteobacteria bacterium]
MDFFRTNVSSRIANPKRHSAAPIVNPKRHSAALEAFTDNYRTNGPT